MFRVHRPSHPETGRAVMTDARKVEKPWGWELHWADTELYVGKILHVRGGEALSLQYHEVKDETIHVLAGSLRLEVGPSADELEEHVLRAGQGWRITPGMVHRMTAETECDILEASTPHLHDLVRLGDRYGRTGTTEP